ncbi:LIM domain and actin-binding protein 1 isoform X2 [Tetranychus urticae]|uniref:LIM domain and actin-binding protein 1 isoform X2 n=1 Tax=Tetranychus urticae TaxID=32264 RepID=UPI00077BD375|nr:LIM domain and actin-binding protein 1 isoform X2 [Tetranychus urticae]XP_015788518.1 LIM domain and actin-binding protein 1 isoform X2 [Tetranychus urticae]
MPKPGFDVDEDSRPCDSKVDDGLENIQVDITNIRQRFESGSEERYISSPVPDKSALQRSESLLIRLQRYQSAISGEKMTEKEADSCSSSGDSSDEEGELHLVRETKRKEKVPFVGLSALRSQWETGKVPRGESLDEPIREDNGTKDELYKLRQRICLGRSASMRQVYEKGGNLSVSPSPKTESLHIESSVKAISLKEKFEKGQIENETDEGRLERFKKDKEEDLKLVTEAETAAREAKNLFKQMDATLSKQTAVSPVIHHYNNNNNNNGPRSNRETPIPETMPSNKPVEIIKCSDPSVKEEVVIETKEIQERYKFFECYQNNINSGSKGDSEVNGVKENGFGKTREMTPPRNGDALDCGPRVEILPDANIVISNNDVNNEIPKIDTTSKMLNKFKQLENQMNQENISHKPIGGTPKPLKRITPPREFTKDVIENEPQTERDPNIVKSSYKTEDVIPVEPKLARSLTAKFENWSQVDEKENKRNSINVEEDALPAHGITKNLVAKFGSIRDDSPTKPTEKTKTRVNRFVNEANITEDCSVCGKRLYPMEKVEFSDMKMHKNCFKCSHCFSSLRLENYTLAAGKFYCIVHFKQLFMAKGNYDEGFGVEQHKEKWRSRVNVSPTVSSRNDSPSSDLDYDDESNEGLKESNHFDQVVV